MGRVVSQARRQRWLHAPGLCKVHLLPFALFIPREGGIPRVTSLELRVSPSQR